MCESFARTLKTLHAPCILILMNDPTNTDQLQTLVNALRQPGFRFILVEYNHLSIYDDVRKLLEDKCPGQPQFELRISGNNYHSLTDQINEAGKAWIMIPDFDILFTLKYEAVCTAFNQRRDFFARNNVVLICFVREGNLKQAPVKIPDCWSLRSLEINLHIEMAEPKLSAISDLGEFKEKSSLGGKSIDEKTKEILNIKNQIKQTDSTNFILLQALYSQLAQLYYDVSEYDQALDYSQKALNLNKINPDYFKEGLLLNNIGEIFKARGEFTQALVFFEKSLKIWREIGDKTAVVFALFNLATTYLEESINEPEKAQTFFTECLEINKKSQNPQITEALKRMGFPSE